MEESTRFEERHAGRIYWTACTVKQCLLSRVINPSGTGIFPEHLLYSGLLYAYNPDSKYTHSGTLPQQQQQQHNYSATVVHDNIEHYMKHKPIRLAINKKGPLNGARPKSRKPVRTNGMEAYKSDATRVHRKEKRDQRDKSSTACETEHMKEKVDV